MQEIWTEIETAPQYHISNLGNVYNTRSRRHLKTGVNKRSGLVEVNLEIDGRWTKLAVHRLVATYFVEENYNENWIVRHKDGDKLNNRADNLMWVEPSKVVRGTTGKGTGILRQWVVKDGEEFTLPPREAP